jgi:predicted phage terminase large subunit-like protein
MTPETVDALTPRQLRQLGRVARGVPARFRDWNEQVTPKFKWRWRHLEFLQRHLDQISDGVIDRLIVEMPPRHGKSEATTIRYPVYRLCADPTLRVIVGAYNHSLAAKFSRKSRKIARHAGLEISDERSAADDWETPAGGGVRAVGVGSGVTGHGGDLIIVDDPIKSRKEAESKVYREGVWEWFQDDLLTRCEPGAALIVINTRWHWDDLVGRILEQPDAERWVRVTLPALADTDDPLGRAPDEALCPERFDRAALEAIRTSRTAYSWSALYQQRPQMREGTMFPRDKVQIVPAAPVGAMAVRYWDNAGTKDDGDYSAGAKVSVKDGLYYVEDIVRGQWASRERNAIRLQTAQMDGVKVRGWVEQEPGSSGKESGEIAVQQLAGFIYKSESVTGDKVTRAETFAAQWQAGNVRLVKGDWNRAYLDEMEAFPNGKNDDQVDASSGAFVKLTLRGPVPRVMLLG